MNVNPVQLFDVESSTFTCILVAGDGKSAVIIDPVGRHWERDVAHLEWLGLTLADVLETHAHPDHVTSAGKLVDVTGARAAVQENRRIMCLEADAMSN
ncbi:MAG: Zn-dependent hydrolase [Massilia sp.]|jgi:sulfur dioxygenase|nr:Zn-dependent hydrolase [Massilia sp.]